MTLHDVAYQIHNLTGGRINREQFTRKELERVIYMWTRPETGSTTYICSLELPDGEWLCKLSRGDYGYDYDLPETRDQEKQLYNELGTAC